MNTATSISNPSQESAVGMNTNRGQMSTICPKDNKHCNDEHNADRVKALLEYWSQWRGTVRHVLLAHMQPRCPLHHVVKAQHQRGELWAHNASQEPIDEALMDAVDSVLKTLSEPHRRTVLVTYVEGRQWSADRRARSIGISRSAYYRRLSNAYQAIDAGIEREIGWRNVVICGG